MYTCAYKGLLQYTAKSGHTKQTPNGKASLIYIMAENEYVCVPVSVCACGSVHVCMSLCVCLCVHVSL